MDNPYLAAIAFAADFGSMEYALKRTPEFRYKNKEVAQANWDAFAQALGTEFFNHVLTTDIARTLINQPPRRLLNNLQWDPPNPEPLVNVSQLIINGVCRVRNSYLHGEKFTGGPEGQWERDTTLIKEAHAVLTEARDFATTPARFSPGDARH